MLEQAIKLTATVVTVILIAASIFAFETWSMAAMARDLRDAKHSLGRPSVVVTVVERPLRDTELLAPFVKVFLDPAKPDLDASSPVFGLVGAGDPKTIVGTVIPVVVAPFDRKAESVRRSHIFIEKGEGMPSYAHLDPAPSVSRKLFVSGTGAASNHGEPHRDNGMTVSSRETKQAAFDVSSSLSVPHGVIPVRDNDGKYANSPLRQWFDQLKSSKGLCCSFADGFAIEDPDWEVKDGHYRVRLEGEWWNVPEEAVITEPNRAGRTMVWPTRINDGDKLLRFDIRCFMPGAMI